MNEENNVERGVVYIKITSEELQKMDQALREHELEMFKRNPNMKPPFSGYSKGAIVDWNNSEKDA